MPGIEDKKTKSLRKKRSVLTNMNEEKDSQPKLLEDNVHLKIASF